MIQKQRKKYTSVALQRDSFLLIKSLLSPSWLQFSGTITRYFAINFVFINVFFWLNKKATEQKKKKRVVKPASLFRPIDTVPF